MVSIQKATSIVMLTALIGALVPASAHAQPRSLATIAVGQSAANGYYLADGKIEAIRETSIAAQVSGQVIERTVRAGDRVKIGQVLVRIDPRAAQQSQAAAAAQLAAAQAQLVAAEKNLVRTKELVEQKFMSSAMLDKVEADYRAAQETVQALRAQKAGAATQTGWHTLSAPFDGIVTTTSTEVGDTAMPGKPLLQLHDPSAMRVALNVPAAVVSQLDRTRAASIEIPDVTGDEATPRAGPIVVVSAADPVNHTQLVRIELPRNLAQLHPGLFARVKLPLGSAANELSARLTIPVSALVVRGDLRAVYVVGDKTVTFRQVRIGRVQADQIEILSGLSAGERVALDPVAAARAAGVVKP